jgi:hypothetical protein
MAVVVLGRYPAYVELAERLGARSFNVAIGIWEGLTATERWDLNRAFIESAIADGCSFLLASPIEDAEPGTFYRRELDYLAARGYVAHFDGAYWELRK